MEIQLNLDAMTERYVRSLEDRAAIYKARAWTLFAVGVLVGYMVGLLTAMRILS